MDFIVQKQPREEYARYGNPTEKTVERKLAALEGAEAAVLYATGMAAVSGLLLAKLSAGDELVIFDELYQRTRELCENELSRFGIVTRIVPTGDFGRLEAAISPATRLLFCESPTNPQLSVIDLERFAALGRKHGIETVVDATMASPYNVRPLEYGIDYVLHSCTKYLAGHNDVLAGSIAASQEKIEPLRKFRGYAGMTNAPHAEYLLLRGLKTFELRMQRHNANGQAVAEYLAPHPRIAAGLLSRAAGSSELRNCPADHARLRRRGHLHREGRRLAADGPGGRCPPPAADRRQHRRRRVAGRAAPDPELLRVYARTATGPGHSRQHDPLWPAGSRTRKT